MKSDARDMTLTFHGHDITKVKLLQQNFFFQIPLPLSFQKMYTCMGLTLQINVHRANLYTLYKCSEKVDIAHSNHMTVLGLKNVGIHINDLRLFQSISVIS